VTFYRKALNFSRTVVFITLLVIVVIFHNELTTCFKLGHLSTDVMNNSKYLYYSQKYSRLHFEEIVNFYLTNSQDLNFKISPFRYIGQDKFIPNSYWGHPCLLFYSPHQPHNDVIMNIVGTHNPLNLPNINIPNFIKLGGVDFKGDRIVQFIANNLIFLDNGLVIPNFNLYDSNKEGVKFFFANTPDLNKQALGVIKNY
jgi:hypothetical protein